MATILTPTEENLSFLSQKLLAGELVAVPTETVYGLAANAFNTTACARIFAAKRRPAFDPLIIHLGDPSGVESIAHVNSLLPQLAKEFWPGPLTLILSKKECVPDIVTSGLNSVAIRVPAHPVFRRLLAFCKLPLAAPSANPFGYISPTSARHVLDSLGGEIDYILDGGPCEVGIESTILDIRMPEKPVILRLGGITRERIETLLGKEVSQNSNPVAGGIMPGQLKGHYSPNTPLRLVPTIQKEDAENAPTAGFLLFRKIEWARKLPNARWLSDTGDLLEAARNLFAQLREMDALGFSAIVAEKAPDEGLGRAINDRLAKAAEAGMSRQ